jgi:protein-disulfide isomerase
MRIRVLAVAAVVALLGCGATPQDVDELKKNQKDILAKLDALTGEVKKVQTAGARPAGPAQPDPNKVYALNVGSSPIKGPKEAPVTIVEFSDYQCPFCAQADALIEEVLADYPNDVRFVYKQFPLTTIHPNAMPASKAALAAGKQGKYWEMHKVLFQNSRALGPEQLKQYAQQVGLDVAKWEADMNSPEIAEQVNAEMREAQAAEVRGTPSIFVNGKRLMNRSKDGFKVMIDEALKAKA